MKTGRIHKALPLGVALLAAGVCAMAQSGAPDEFGSASPSSDRPAAEWVPRIVGSVVLAGDSRAIRDLAELPPGNVEVHTVNLV